MAVGKSEIKATYPLPAYNYVVTLLLEKAATVVSFSEVSGLTLDYAPVTYKHGLSFLAGDRIIRGMPQPIRITLKKGIVQGGNYLHSWIEKAYSDPALDGVKRDILIDLCDERGKPVIRWTVQGAMPIKLTAPNFNANANEVAIETMELIAHDLKVQYNP